MSKYGQKDSSKDGNKWNLDQKSVPWTISFPPSSSGPLKIQLITGEREVLAWIRHGDYNKKLSLDLEKGIQISLLKIGVSAYIKPPDTNVSLHSSAIVVVDSECLSLDDARNSFVEKGDVHGGGCGGEERGNPSWSDI